MPVCSLSRLRTSTPIDTLDWEYADDLDALDGARRLCMEHAVVVYDGDRFVGRVEQEHVPVGVSDDVNAVRETVRAARQRLQQSKLVLARSAEKLSRSASAIDRSKDALDRVRVSSSWNPNGMKS